jgi:phage terminase small subunit
MDQVMKFYSEFGMTPSSRSRVKVDIPTEEDEMAGFLFGKNVKVTN